MLVNSTYFDRENRILFRTKAEEQVLVSAFMLETEM